MAQPNLHTTQLPDPADSRMAASGSPPTPGALSPIRARCGAPKADGSPCTSTALLPESGHCLFHTSDAIIPAEIKRALRSAGATKANLSAIPADKVPPVELSTVEGVRDYLVGVIRCIALGLVTPNVANVLIQAANSAKGLLELQGFEELAEIKRQLAAAELAKRLPGRRL